MAVSIIVLIFFAPLLRCLPNSTLAAVIFLAFQSILRKVTEVPKLWKLKKPDCVVWLSTFFCVLILGVQLGLVIGVGTSMVVMLRGSSRPSYAVLGRLQGTDVFRNISRYPTAIEEPGGGRAPHPPGAIFATLLSLCMTRQ